MIWNFRLLVPFFFFSFGHTFLPSYVWFGAVETTRDLTFIRKFGQHFQRKTNHRQLKLYCRLNSCPSRLRLFLSKNSSSVSEIENRKAQIDFHILYKTCHVIWHFIFIQLFPFFPTAFSDFRFSFFWMNLLDEKSHEVCSQSSFSLSLAKCA